MIRRMLKPATFPRELPIGPRRMVKTPPETTASARAACNLGVQGDRDAAELLIDDATGALLSHLEEALIEAYMIDESEKSHYIGRAGGVTYAIGPRLGPRVGRHGAAPPTIRRLRLIKDAANALSAAAALTIGKLHC